MKAELDKIKNDVAGEESNTLWERLLDWEQLNIYDIVVERYALQQIEKDRVRVRQSVNASGLHVDDTGLNNIYNQTPIILD